MTSRLDWKRIATIVTIVLLLILGFALWRAGEENIPPPTEQQTMLNGKAEGRRAQFASWQFTYDRATTLSDQVTQEIEGIHDGVYWKDGKVVAHMRAQRALYNTLTHDFSLTGPVHFEFLEKGKMRTFDADSASWSESLETLHIPGPATLSTKHFGGRLVVENVTVDLRSGQYTVGKIEGSGVP